MIIVPIETKKLGFSGAMHLTEISVLTNALGHLKLTCLGVQILKVNGAHGNFLHVQTQPTLLLIGRF